MNVAIEYTAVVTVEEDSPDHARLNEIADGAWWLNVERVRNMGDVTFRFLCGDEDDVKAVIKAVDAAGRMGK